MKARSKIILSAVASVAFVGWAVAQQPPAPDVFKLQGAVDLLSDQKNACENRAIDTYAKLGAARAELAAAAERIKVLQKQIDDAKPKEAPAAAPAKP